MLLSHYFCVHLKNTNDLLFEGLFTSKLVEKTRVFIRLYSLGFLVFVDQKNKKK